MDGPSENKWGFRSVRRGPKTGQSGSFASIEGVIIIRLGAAASMSANKKLIETYLATSDKSKLGQLLTDDVEWIEWGDGVPATGAITRGKADFIKNYGNDELRGEVTRLTEENNVVVAEGTAHVTKKDGRTFRVQYCNIFELENGKIKRKSSFGALVKDST